MKILSVRMEGFGPFKTSQEVDFTRYDTDGLFLITGQTGAGKSTILDAICFALYGKTPRFQSEPVRVRSDHCEVGEKTEVRLVFDVDGREYRLTRNPSYERPKGRGTGTTEEKPDALLEIREGADWIGVARQQKKVEDSLTPIVKLDQGQFMQVILLAQNRFQEFLLAGSGDRKKLLSTLFNTPRFNDYVSYLKELRSDLDGQVRAAGADVDRTVEDLADRAAAEPPPAGAELEWAAEIRANAGAAKSEAAERLGRAAETQQNADAVVTAARELDQRQQRLARARAKMRELTGQAAEIEEMRAAAESAQRAARVMQFRLAAEHARSAVAAVRPKLDAAAEAYDGDPTADLRKVVGELDRATGELQPALAVEKNLPGLQSAEAKARTRLDALEQQAAELVQRKGEFTARRAELEAEEEAVRDTAADLAAANQTLTTLQAALKSAGEAAELEHQHTEARKRELALGERRTEAGKRVDDLRRAFLQGQAAHLARESLTDGEPCPVCGAVEHPHPAAWSSDQVTQDDITGAEEELAKAVAAERSASAKVGEVAEHLAKAKGVAGDRTVTQAQAEFEQAESRAATAQRATNQLQQLRDERKRIAIDLADIDTREKTRGAQQLQLANELTRTQIELSTGQEAVERARAGFPSVEARVAALTAQRAAADKLRTAQDDLAAAEQELTRATGALDANLATEGFASQAEASAAERDAAELTALQRSVKQHDDSLTEARGVLAEPDLQDVPAQPADLEAKQGLAEFAKKAHEAAIKAEAAATSDARFINDRADRLEQELARSQTLRERLAVLSRLSLTASGKSPNELGMDLESYVLAAELEQIVTAANATLSRMSSHRYTLVYSDQRDLKTKNAGLELEILDSHTGIARPPRSLSGGETFLAALALALGLAEVVTERNGGIQLDTLFIDEGFGSLDAVTLQIAMDTIENLRRGGRTIGLISHVDTMKEKIGNKLHVDVAAEGWSVIRQTA